VVDFHLLRRLLDLHLLVGLLDSVAVSDFVHLEIPAQLLLLFAKSHLVFLVPSSPQLLLAP